MNIVLLSGLATAGLLMTGAPASASQGIASPKASKASTGLVSTFEGRKAGSGHLQPGVGIARPNMHHMGGMKPGGHLTGFRPRPGYHGIPRTDVYRRPFQGFLLPRYWVQPTFFVSNFRNYGLSAPMPGYNWTRYYDDAVLADSRGYVQDYRSGINWDNGNDRTYDYREPEYGPSIRPDDSAYDFSNDSNVAFAAPDGSSYSYDGDWQGEYVDPQGRVFEGEWEGRVTRHDGVAGPGYPAPRKPAPAPRRPAAGAPYGGAEYNDSRYDDRDRGDYYNVPSGYEGYERCLKSNGVTGAAIGALLGGVAGNRIAGRGNRTGGTLVGAGIGGLLGVAVEKANDKCRQYRPREAGAQGYSYAQPRPQPGHGAGWQGGYYYYPQSAPTVTVISMAPVTTTTTTVTEEVYYETVRSAPRKKAVRKWKPKPACACR